MLRENRSERAAYIAALAAPILLWGVRTSWLWLLCGGLAAVAVYALLLHARRNLTQLSRMVFGLGGARAVQLLQMGALAVAGGWLLRQTTGIVPNLAVGYLWIAVPLLCLASVALAQGRRAALATEAILFWLPVITVTVVLLAALPEIKKEWIVPVGGIEQIVIAFAVFLIPVTGLYLRTPEKNGVGWLLWVVVIAALIVLVTSGCISPRQVVTEALPFYTLAASSRLLGYASRFDAVISVAVVSAVYCALTTLGQFVYTLSQAGKRWGAVVFYSIMLLSSLLLPWISTEIVAAYFVFSWAVIPICTLILEKGKK